MRKTMKWRLYCDWFLQVAVSILSSYSSGWFQCSRKTLLYGIETCPATAENTWRISCTENGMILWICGIKLQHVARAKNWKKKLKLISFEELRWEGLRYYGDLQPCGLNKSINLVLICHFSVVGSVWVEWIHWIRIWDMRMLNLNEDYVFLSIIYILYIYFIYRYIIYIMYIYTHILINLKRQGIVMWSFDIS